MTECATAFTDLDLCGVFGFVSGYEGFEGGDVFFFDRGIALEALVDGVVVEPETERNLSPTAKLVYSHIDQFSVSTLKAHKLEDSK